MHVEVNGTRLWFDVDGPSLVPAGSAMRDRPTVVLVHGGPGSYDHSYFKPEFAPLARDSQVVFLDLRDHGRSGRGDPAAWDFEVCARDLRAFCDAVGIVRPVVYGHSMGGIVTLLYAALNPGHAAAVVLQSTLARFDLERLVEGFRRRGGDDIAEIARRAYGGEPVSPAEWARAFACFGPSVPDEEQLARRTGNPALAIRGMALLRALDVRDALQRVDVPTLVCVGALDPVTPVDAARELVAGLPRDHARLELLENAGHFPWLDDPGRYWPLVSGFVRAAAAQSG